jgi:hypothetical protein
MKSSTTVNWVSASIVITKTSYGVNFLTCFGTSDIAVTFYKIEFFALSFKAFGTNQKFGSLLYLEN